MRAAFRLAAPYLLSAILVASVSAGASAAAFECRETAMTQAAATLPGISTQLASAGTLRILAIGSSSTEGIGASSKDKSYPSRLQDLLGKAWPKVGVTIRNAGIGGETAPETLLRLKASLSETRYDLVIWQVGTNDAVRGGDIEAFKAMILDGIATVRAAGPALVILDPQFFPSVREPARYQSFVEAIAETARGQAVPVLSRFKTMLGWYRHDAEAFRSALAADSFHMSDAGYDCLARDMAMSLVTMTGSERPVMAQSTR